MPRQVWRQFSITPIWGGELSKGSVTIFATRIETNTKGDIVLFGGKQAISFLRVQDHQVKEWKDGQMLEPPELAKTKAEEVSRG